MDHHVAKDKSTCVADRKNIKHVWKGSKNVEVFFKKP